MLYDCFDFPITYAMLKQVMEEYPPMKYFFVHIAERIYIFLHTLSTQCACMRNVAACVNMKFHVLTSIKIKSFWFQPQVSGLHGRDYYRAQLAYVRPGK